MCCTSHIHILCIYKHIFLNACSFSLISLLVDVTLDPDTAYHELVLSKDGKQVHHGTIKQNIPNYSKRFDSCLDVLGKEGFSSGKFYFEVQVKGKAEWDLGVARESINRKGKVRLSPEDGCWTLVLRNENQYKACENPCVSLSQREMLEKVGVFVDYEEGLVSFYDVESSSHIHSFTGQSFTGKLYPFLSPCYSDEGKNSNPLIISPVHISNIWIYIAYQTWSTRSESLNMHVVI